MNVAPSLVRREPELSRTADPYLSLTSLVKSRGVMGAVVDSLGLRLRSATPEFPAGRLDGIRVDPTAASDTIQVTFYQNGVKAMLAGREARALMVKRWISVPSGSTVRSAPDVPSASLTVIPREMAVDNLLAASLAVWRERHRSHRCLVLVTRPPQGATGGQYCRPLVPAAQYPDCQAEVDPP